MDSFFCIQPLACSIVHPRGAKEEEGSAPRLWIKPVQWPAGECRERTRTRESRPPAKHASCSLAPVPGARVLTVYNAQRLVRSAHMMVRMLQRAGGGSKRADHTGTCRTGVTPIFARASACAAT